jgi:Tat protein secretion system quality control protein TatD with DNase activity
MTFDNKGAGAIAKMPLSRLLPETDALFAQNKGVPYAVVHINSYPAACKVIQHGCR